ncbi:MAG: FAD-dependent oxidoreductase [Gloeobacteraceae cyanobacterium ES-bin-316]|nr:FAD-dependent oxidoreductase [Ferruginibacter sp.]
MQHKISIKLLPAEAANEDAILHHISSHTGKKLETITGFRILKKSIDARGKRIFINLTLNAFIDEPFTERPAMQFDFKDIGHSQKKVLIVGAGPAGMFAALKLIEAGIKPIIIERGKDIRARRRDLAKLNKEGIINPESNYCFGEGGAGTYSDGKLYTRSNKRGDINRILQLFVRFGAPENILFDAHPHIGTNKLPQIIAAMRQMIVDCGGQVLFEKKLTDFSVDKNAISFVETADGEIIRADAYILATGHSARDIFALLHRKNILIEAKPFALGVRIEHPQALIDSLQYHSDTRGEFLPPASYSLVQQVEQKGVFSFCMCPGGIIAPASTNPGELVVNGWSPSKRDNPFANSGMVVQVAEADAIKSLKNTRGLQDLANNPLLFMYFQQMVEEKAYTAGGGKFVAPAQRMHDFVEKKNSFVLPANSYLPGLQSANLNEVLPDFIYQALAGGFKAFGKKMKGYYTNEAVVVATESRTSSPVRIPRDAVTLCHPQLSNLYPCAEGAGYAGGIVSAAMDGERIAALLKEKLLHL